MVSSAARRYSAMARRRRRPPAPAGGRGPRAGGGGLRAVGSSSASSARPASGPSTIAAATARLSATIGLPVRSARAARRGRGSRRQSVSSARARPVVGGGDRRLQLVLADGAPRRPPRRAARSPSAIAAASQSERSCSSSGTSSPSASVRAGRRASVSSISASRPPTSGSSGSARRAIRARRIASAGELGAGQLGALARRVALVEDQVEDAAAPRAAAPPAPSARRQSGTAPARPRCVCLARLIRCAIVASGTRKARRSRPWSGRRPRAG